MPEPTLLIIFTTSFLVALSGALIPGPLLAVNITETSHHGFWAGPGLILGHGILEFSLMLLLAQGLSRLLEREMVTGVIGLAGGLVLLGLGLSMVRKAPRARMEFKANPRHHVSALLVVPLAGAAASLFNPSWVLWWATIGANYVLWALGLGFLGLVAFYGGHVLADLAWYSLVSGVVASGRRWMKDAVYRGLLAGCGLFLLGLGGYFIARGSSSLD